jgi:tetratricopeptide (TPR) repeat protein
MTPVLWLGFIIGGAGLIFLIVLIVRHSVNPRKIGSIERLIESGNVKSALRQVKVLLVRNERNIDAHWLLGECYRKENRPELALVEYKYIINAARFSHAASKRKVLERLGEMYLQLGQLDEAQKEFILLSKIEPDNYELSFKIARLFEERDYTDSALSHYLKVIGQNPSYAPAHFRLGVIYFKKNALSEAGQELLEAVKLDKENYAAYYYLGKIARMTGDKNRALSMFDKALHDGELRQRSYLEKATIFVAEKTYEDAIDHLLKAAELGEKDTAVIMAVRYVLAQCYESIDDLRNAVEQWEWLYERKPGYADVEAKLSLYGALRADDKLKDFLIAPGDKFSQYCEHIITLLGLKVHQVISSNTDTRDYTAYDADRRPMRGVSGLCLVRLIRSTDPVGYEEARGLYDAMRKMNASRSICVTASKFTKNAVEFSQIRPVDLIEKDELTKLLQKITI